MMNADDVKTDIEKNKIKNTLGYKMLELNYAVEDLKYSIISALPMHKQLKVFLLRKILRELFVLHDAKRDYINSFTKGADCESADRLI